MKRTLLYILFIILMGQACTKECYEGNETTQEEAIQIIQENELEDSIFAAQILGSINCLDNEPIGGLSVNIKDSHGFEFDLESDGFGNFDLPYLQEGKHVLKFTNTNLPSYTTDELDAIITRVDEIRLGVTPSTNIEKLAYDLINPEDGITTLDLVLFTKLRDGSMEISEIDFPWRYVLTDSLDQATNISDSIIINLEMAQKLDLRITPIYFGDPNGQFCN